MIAKAAWKVKLFIKYSSPPPVQFTEALHNKSLYCKDAFSKQRRKSVFVTRFSLIVRNNVLWQVLGRLFVKNELSGGCPLKNYGLEPISSFFTREVSAPFYIMIWEGLQFTHSWLAVS